MLVNQLIVIGTEKTELHTEVELTLFRFGNDNDLNTFDIYKPIGLCNICQIMEASSTANLILSHVWKVVINFRIVDTKSVDSLF